MAQVHCNPIWTKLSCELIQLKVLSAPVAQQCLALEDTKMIFVRVKMEEHDPKSKKLVDKPSDVLLEYIRWYCGR